MIEWRPWPGLQTWVLKEINQLPISGEGINDTLPMPLDLTGADVAGCHEGQLPIRLHIECSEVCNECLVRSSRNADADLARRLLDGRKLLLKASDQRRLI